MKIDITLKITPNMVRDANGNEKKTLVRHLGTHFDVMDKEFPLDYTQRKGIVFDVSFVKDRDIEIRDVDISKVGSNMFVAFYTGFIEEAGYGTIRYFKEHPQVSPSLIDELLDRRVSIIGIDFAGLRRGKEHTPMDQHCADHDLFVVENLCNLKSVVDKGGSFVANTYPMNFTDVSGLPCRVIADVENTDETIECHRKEML
jgi:kynurenine formamidase